LDVDDHCARISAIDSKSRLLRDTRSSRISKGGGQPASWRTEPIIVPSVETTTSEYSLGDQSARIKLNYAASFRFLRHPKKPSSAPPLAKSGSADGSGTIAIVSCAAGLRDEDDQRNPWLSMRPLPPPSAKKLR